MTNNECEIVTPALSFVIRHLDIRLCAVLRPPLGPGLHAGLLGFGLALVLDRAGELLGALLAANPLIIDLGTALGTMPILDFQDELGTGADADHNSAAFLLNEPS